VRHVTIGYALRHVAVELRSVLRMAGPAAAARYAVELLRNLPAIARTGTLDPADAAMRARGWRLRIGPHAVDLAGRYWSGARELYGRRVYLPSRELSIQAGDRVVDLGANAGLFTLLAAAHGADVLTVEAQSGFVPEIEQNLASNHLRERATIVNALVGAGVGIFSDPSDVLTGSHGRVVPPVVELGALLERHGFDRVDFLKCDIEGSEFALFRGAIPWLDRVRRIAMEVHPQFGDVPALAQQLRARGFRVRTTDDRGLETEQFAERAGYLYAWRAAS
jgi:FkbM family methyltransferase